MNSEDMIGIVETAGFDPAAPEGVAYMLGYLYGGTQGADAITPKTDLMWCGWWLTASKEDRTGQVPMIGLDRGMQIDLVRETGVTVNNPVFTTELVPAWVRGYIDGYLDAAHACACARIGADRPLVFGDPEHPSTEMLRGLCIAAEIPVTVSGDAEFKTAEGESDEFGALRWAHAPVIVVTREQVWRTAHAVEHRVLMRRRGVLVAVEQDDPALRPFVDGMAAEMVTLPGLAERIRAALQEDG